MASQIGTFIVANYEAAQPTQYAWDSTPYCWVVETTFKGATDDKCAYMVTDLAGYPGKKRQRQLYVEHQSNAWNHTENALEFMRAFILESGKSARLLSMANTSSGMLFVFI
jgi:hypothetical protein